MREFQLFLLSSFGLRIKRFLLNKGQYCGESLKNLDICSCCVIITTKAVIAVMYAKGEIVNE